MNTNMWIPFCLISSANKNRRSRMAQSIALSMCAPPAQQVAVAAISADMQARREEQQKASLLANVTSAVKGMKDRKFSEEDLQHLLPLPEHKELVNALKSLAPVIPAPKEK